MQRHIPAGVALLVLLAGVAWCDIAPRNPVRPRIRPKNAPNPPAAVQPPVVYMRTADVSATLSKVEISPEKAASLREKGIGPGSWIQANVACDFDLFCADANNGKDVYWGVFPLRCGNEPASKVLEFAVHADGQSVKDVKAMDGWRAPGLPGEKTKLYGYRWVCTATRGETSHVKVNYTAMMPLEDGKATFRYILRTGSMWAGPIDRENIRIRAAKDLKIEPAAKSVLKITRDDEGSILLDLKNARPTEDLRVNVTLAEAQTAAQK